MADRIVWFTIDTAEEFDLLEPWDEDELRDTLEEMEPEELKSVILEGTIEAYDWKISMSSEVFLECMACSRSQ